MEKPNPELLAGTAAYAFLAVEPRLSITVAIQGLGEKTMAAAEGNFIGTRGQGLRLEAFRIEFKPPIDGLGLEYMARMEDAGETPWIKEGEFVGAPRLSKSICAFALRLTGPLSALYSVQYLGHFKMLGDSVVCRDGEICSAREHLNRCEGLQVLVRLRGI